MSRRTRATLLFVIAAFAAARAVAADATPPPARDRGLWVDVSITYERNGKPVAISTGDILTRDDNYRVVVEANRDAYLYVYQIDTSRRVEAIFPNHEYSSAQNPVIARIVYSLPPEGRWLHLDDTPGVEHVVVMASDEPFADPEAQALLVRDSTDRSSDSSRGAWIRHSDGTFFYRLAFEHR